MSFSTLLTEEKVKLFTYIFLKKVQPEFILVKNVASQNLGQGPKSGMSGSLSQTDDDMQVLSPYTFITYYFKRESKKYCFKEN